MSPPHQFDKEGEDDDNEESELELDKNDNSDDADTADLKGKNYCNENNKGKGICC